MTPPTPTETGETPDLPPRRGAALAWRVLAIALIVVATVLAAHVLVRPAGRGPRVGEAGAPGEEDALFDSPPAARRDVPESDWAEARADLAHVMAGILMAAAEEEGDYGDPDNQTPQDRREFLAERFGLPADYPRSAAPADVVPDGASVLAVFDHPQTRGTRMVLLRIPQPVVEAVALLRSRYTADGWRMSEPPKPEEQKERGWLLWFTRGRSHRVLFVQPNDDEQETLAAVCDLEYE
ncbi:MAG TPA: hypothetical protein VMY35_03175 [Phycisphaerae bacterium]|nr:hypothetical protein [Phycisphaerae bacterium]